jgi:hypothetical protein
MLVSKRKNENEKKKKKGTIETQVRNKYAFANEKMEQEGGRQVRDGQRGETDRATGRERKQIELGSGRWSWLTAVV